MLREIAHGIGFGQCAAEGGERDGLVQDPSLKCLKNIHTEPEGWRERERERERASNIRCCHSRWLSRCVCFCV